MKINGMNGTFAVRSETIDAVAKKGYEKTEPRQDSPIKVTISAEGIKSYKDSILKGSGLSNGVIMTDYETMISGRLPSKYGDRNENGEYEKNYRSIEDKANDLLGAYASIYDEIVRGHEEGTREAYVADDSSETGYRKLSMEDEIAELNKAFTKKAEQFEAQNKNNKEVIEILEAHAEKVIKLSGGRTSIAKGAQKELERAKKEVVPDNLSEKIVKASKVFADSYKLGGSFSTVAKILDGIKII